jgi:hypothetical protein
MPSNGQASLANKPSKRNNRTGATTKPSKRSNKQNRRNNSEAERQKRLALEGNCDPLSPRTVECDRHLAVDDDAELSSCSESQMFLEVQTNNSQFLDVTPPAATLCSWILAGIARRDRGQHPVRSASQNLTLRIGTVEVGKVR